MEINFGALKGEIIELLDEKEVMVLATSAHDRVTARSVSCVHKGLNVFFQTDKNFLKIKQIEKNSNVALCVDNIQVEGKAVKKGHPLAERNEEFLRLYKEKHYGSYEKYSSLENEVVIKVEPKLVTLWKYEGDKCCRDFLYIRENKAVRKYYDINE